MSPVNSAANRAAQTAATDLQPANSPNYLSVRFTTAHDHEKIVQLFHGERKQQLDPNGKVRARSSAELETPIAQGSAIIATDPSGKIRFFGMAADHFKYTGNAVAITEVGGIMSDVRGFRLTQVASAMLALRESIRLREQYPCIATQGIHALVAKDNTPAQKVFERDLSWTGIQAGPHRETLFDTQGKYSSPNDRASRLWYSFQDSALNSARNLVTRTIAQGALSSRDGQKIPVHLDERAHELV